MASTGVQVQQWDVLKSQTTLYLVMDFNGQGCFGKVAKCLDLATCKLAAVKIHKEGKSHAIKRELRMLNALRCLDPDKTNIVKFIENFSYLNLSCLAFEMLDMSLWDLIEEKKSKPLMNLNEIRPVTHQLMVAFDALKSLGIMHTDLKVDNIMLVDHKHQPYKIKLIDFGLARLESRVKTGTIMQACAYRAPEVYLGFPLSTAVDMWGVGCVMAHLYFGQAIFPHKCPYNWMKVMLLLLGQPDEVLLDSGLHTCNYFEWEEDPTKPGWTLITPEDYQAVTGAVPQVSSEDFDSYNSLEQAAKLCPIGDDPMEFYDQMEFVRLLKRCLCLNSAQRITPREALSHNFLTMAHLAGDIHTSVYAVCAAKIMAMCLRSDLDKSDCELSKKAEADSNNAPTADTPKPPTISQKEDNEIGREKASDRNSGSDDSLNMERPFTGCASMPGFDGKNDAEAASPHSAACFHHVTGNTSAPLDIADGDTPNVSLVDGVAAAIKPTGAESVKTAGQRTTFCRRVYKFFGRTRRILSVGNKMTMQCIRQ